MDIKPIKNERDYRRALKEIDSLMDAKANTVAGDRLDVLVMLAEAWKEKHHAIEAPEPIAAVQFAMEQRGLNCRDLERFIGSRARVAEVLNRKRSLTLPMIRRLHEGLGIPAGSFDTPRQIASYWMTMNLYFKVADKRKNRRNALCKHVKALNFL